LGRYSGGFYTSSITENFVSFSNIEIIHVTGTGGDDTFGPAGGTDTIDGGPGIDTVADADFSKATVALNIDDSDSSKTISIVGGPSITNVERFTSLVLGSGDDLVSYTRRIDNSIRTGGGSDLINAGLGVDIVWGGEGLDVLTVDYSSNTYAGSTPLAGITSILTSDDTGGFTGSYQAYYGDSYVTYDSANYYTDFDYVGFSNIEQFHITGTFVADDILTGGGDDTIIASAGDDAISSGAGDDILVGGLGVDSLQGGTGVDHFVYNSASEGGDVITDFDGAVDSIMVSAAGFGGLLIAGINILASGHYVENTTGLAMSAPSVGQFIYQTNINQLLWDGDGSGGLSATPLATFQSPQAWSGSRIQVVA
jgi:Ca2+-binding RTX toxin-like protein